MNVVARGSQPVVGLRSDYIKTAQVHMSDGIDPARLVAALGLGPMGLILLFASPGPGFAALVQGVTDAAGGCPVVACTTAGELGQNGYEDGQAIAIGLPAAQFSARCLPIEGLSRLDADAVTDRVIETRVHQAEAQGADFPNCFAMVVVDGLSLREDALVAALSRGLGDMPLFGGSAADGTTFGETLVAIDGQVMEDAAVLCLVRTSCRTQVFTLDHLEPTSERMVVTEADPERRIVKTINAEPAAREYARIVGKDPDQLSTFTFASNPVAVRIGGTHHVRAIQRVTNAGELVFFSAIDEGMVLSVAEASDLTGHLDRELETLAEGGAPEAIIGCDCLLRRIEAEQTQASGRMSEVLRRHRVVGFSTYGEQFGPLHVNHTMTGVAIYPPKDPSR